MKITIRLALRDEGEFIFEYDDAAQALRDNELLPLFDAGLVESCAIESNGRRLCGIPFMTSEHFKTALGPYT